MGRIARGCCCGVAFVVIIVAAVIGFNAYHVKLPNLSDTAQTEVYVESFHTTLSNYTRRIEQIESDPTLREAVTAAQKHAAHIREMKEVVAAQNQCERALEGLKPPSTMADVHTATTSYMKELGDKYSHLQAEVKHKDMPEMNSQLQDLAAQSKVGADRVDKALRQVPHYKIGQKQLQDYWDEFKQSLARDAPPSKA